MKILATSDWHIRDRRPISRTEEFIDQQWDKLEQIVEIVGKKNIDLILHAGDVFDSPNVSYGALFELTSIFKTCSCDFACVFGQHDLRFHSLKTIRNTPLANFCQNKDKYILPNADYSYSFPSPAFSNRPGKIGVAGCSWGEDLLPRKTTDADVFVIHRLVSKMPLFPGHKDFTTPDELFSLGYPLVVSGDNHKTFVVEKGDQVLINPGSLMRNNRDQKEHKPCVFIIEFGEHKVKSVEQVYLDIKEDVFVPEKEIPEELEDKRMLEFLKSLKDKAVSSPDFKENLRQAVKKAKDPDIANLIEEIVVSAESQLQGH